MTKEKISGLEETRKKEWLKKMIELSGENLHRLQMQEMFFQRKNIAEPDQLLLQKLGQIQTMKKQEEEYLNFLKDKMEEMEKYGT